MALRAVESDEDVRLPAPNRDREGVPMALRAAEIDEDALGRSRDREGADVFTGVFNGADVFDEQLCFECQLYFLSASEWNHLRNAR